jgi:hypothetical protein
MLLTGLGYIGMTSGDKRILWLGGVAAALVIAFLAIYATLSMDSAPPEDSDLRVVRREVPDDDNGYFLFVQAGERVRMPDDRDWIDDARSDKDWDQAKVDVLLSDNAEALALWRQGMERPAIQVPEFQDITSDFSYFFPWMKLSELADLSADSLHRQGKDKEAFDEALRMVHFGRRAMAAQGPLVTYLLGRYQEEKGLARLRKMIPEARLTPAEWAVCQKSLADGPSSGEAMAEAYRVEYESMCRIFERLRDGTFADRSGKAEPKRGPSMEVDFFLQVNRCKTSLAGWARPYVQDSTKIYTEMVWPEPMEQPLTRRSMAAELASGNGIGNITLYFIAKNNKSYLMHRCRQDASASATRVLVALRRYQMDKGDLPERLDDLVPTYLEAVPRDEFDGKPLRYSRDKKVIYSVNDDLVDGGGAGKPFSDWEPDEKAPDVVFPVRF